MSEAVMGDFDTRADAQRAIAALRAMGVPPADISVIVEDPYNPTDRDRDRDEVAAGALTGAASGAILGGLAGWLLSLGPFEQFAVGRLAVEHASVATLAGAGVGAALLGLLGAVAGLTFDDQRDPSVEEGDVLITVRSNVAPSERIESAMRENNALNVQRTGDIGGDPQGGASYAPVSLPHDAPDAGGPVARTTPSPQGTPMVRSGQDVYTLDNEKLGEVGDTGGDYFTVRRGMLHSDLYVPYEDVHDIRPDAVYVNAVAGEVDLKNWAEAPRVRGHQGEGPTRP